MGRNTNPPLTFKYIVLQYITTQYKRYGNVTQKILKIIVALFKDP
jgi:hypothetical protein